MLWISPDSRAGKVAPAVGCGEKPGGGPAFIPPGTSHLFALLSLPAYSISFFPLANGHFGVVLNRFALVEFPSPLSRAGAWR